jgi:nicotinate dehydrogenase subunit A
VRVDLTVNGAARRVAADPDTSLLDVLRSDLGLRGARFGCGLGQCGACVVLVDGRAVPACDTPLWAAEGRAVTTVEGLGDGGQLHPVQRAVLEEQAGQCGFCLSGLVVRAAALLAEHPHPDEATVAAALDGHLCRCGIQHRMIAAVVRAGQEGP